MEHLKISRFCVKLCIAVHTEVFTHNAVTIAYHSYTITKASWDITTKIMFLWHCFYTALLEKHTCNMLLDRCILIGTGAIKTLLFLLNILILPFWVSVRGFKKHSIRTTIAGLGYILSLDKGFNLSLSSISCCSWLNRDFAFFVFERT